MDQWPLRDVVRARLSSSESDRTWWALTALLSQRIHDGLAGKVSLKSINDILEEEVV